MKYCKNCGKQLDDAAYICPYCGVKQDNGGEDTGSVGWCVLGFCIPIVGLILWLVWKDQKPNNARQAGVGALACVIISVVFYVILFATGMSLSIWDFL